MDKTLEKEVHDVVIRFSGDSGDGMQLTGTLFSDTSALLGNGISTFPDYPAEIRAPQGTIAGVSGFQVHFGDSRQLNPGDYCDVLVAMNPAALKANRKWLKSSATVILDGDSLTEEHIRKAGFTTLDPIAELGLEEYNVVVPDITTMTKEALASTGLDNKAIVKCKNMFALGICFYIYNRPEDHARKYLDGKFAKKNPAVAEANKMAIDAGYNYAANTHQFANTYTVAPAKLEKGTYRSISGNVATAWGLCAAAEKANLPLFCGSYPITPATVILEELAKRRDLGVKTVQAEDEIAGICTAIGAAYAGNFAVTTTSGPGLSLKSEALGLAVMTELPLVVVDVQRGGPSTGLPTKTEQTDLFQALYGRNGESPLAVVAAATPTDCFTMAFEAARIAVEHMTPVILLCAWFCWEYQGYWLEQPLISLCRSVMGLWGDGDFQAASFADLWRNGFGMPYEQRNSLVVGFIMGFAVIPVIFTISEDALSNVPPSLIAASEALGASRWQMVRTVVLPVASAGIFSALMIGLGRAVGETMIVLMATGNTPIMDWNIFNGMRTLSANIATELPEAAQDSTHYRVLFLGGLILFSMTFILNTLAEIVRQRLRKRFNVV